MKIAFFGTPEFAAVSLRRLFDDGSEVVCVITQPDKPAGRGNKKNSPPVKILAQEHVPVYQPETLRDGTVETILRGHGTELGVVVAYGRILPRSILELPAFGCVNIHASLLPKYRGAAPIQRAVLAGERETGVVSMYMSEELDAGDVILETHTEIGEYETSGELFARLAVLGADTLSETVRRVSNGSAERKPQTHALATYAPPLSKSEAPVDWNKTPREIVNHIRGMNPSPTATAVFNGITMKIYAARITETTVNGEPGSIISSGRDGFTVACAGGAVLITELQAPGGRRMKAADYIRGHPLC